MSELGGKGANLIKLTRGGFHVPGGFIVKASAFDEFASSCSLFENLDDYDNDIDGAISMIISKMNSTPIPDWLRESVLTSLSSIVSDPLLPNPLFAVRSSGVTEDLEEASFAGMNDTFINVHADCDAVCEAIRSCWKSLFGKRSVVYRIENGYPAYLTSIAVVVQVMIPSESSGVIFTADAQSGSRGIISLDGVQGLGEALVSGQVNTDHWTVRKAYDKRPMEVMDCVLGQQAFKLWSKYPEPGTDKIELTEEEGAKSCFTDAQVNEVCAASCDIETYYGIPMDIEFCFYRDTLFIVQARPITRLPIIPDSMNPLKNTDSIQWSAWVSFCRTIASAFLILYSACANVSGARVSLWNFCYSTISGTI